jgi:beta-galactosidase/beta-glucuronidase
VILKTQKLYTKYAKLLDENNPWPEYPRPQLVRNSYFNLNGFWDYHLSEKNEIPTNYDGKILVPFPIESLLSKVHKRVKPSEFLCYRRFFSLPKKFLKDIVLLHFGAVDQKAVIYLNQTQVFVHEGGYFPFSIDITNYLKEENELVVMVTDPSNQSFQAYGKQHIKPSGIWYTPITGIWQSVWIESVNHHYIKDLIIKTHYDESKVEFQIPYNKDLSGVVKIWSNKKLVVEKKFKESNFFISLNNFIPWNINQPHLYEVTIETKTDYVESYFAMRKISIEDGKFAKAIFLNNKEVFLSGVLDQGYYSDGLYTPACDQAFIDDISTMKQMGFQVLRKHVKIEPSRWYYHCDCLGMLVWQDFVSGGRYSLPKMSILPILGIKSCDDQKNLKTFGRELEIEKQSFFNEVKATVTLLQHHPSIIIWTIFNEGWGQFQSQINYDFLKSLDNTRLIDAVSGWFDQGGCDFASKHIYFKKINIEKESRPVVLSEFGGFSHKIALHSYHLSKEFGYRKFASLSSLSQAIEKLYLEEIIPSIKNGLCACIYTQLSDVEEETNGLVTYDREVVKINPQSLLDIHKKLLMVFEEKNE